MTDATDTVDTVDILVRLAASGGGHIAKFDAAKHSAIVGDHGCLTIAHMQRGAVAVFAPGAWLWWCFSDVGG